LRFLPAPFVLVALAATASPARPDSIPDPSRGPSEIRDAQLLAQPRLTLPALSPRTTRPGAWALQLSALWANSFAWAQDVPGEHPAVRSFLIDGEAVILDATVRRGLTPSLDAGLRVLVQNRSGGVLDGLIDWWHHVIDAPQGGRPDFRTDAFRVEGTTKDGTLFSWNDRSGWGLGDMEAEARWRVRDGGRSSPSVALVARASLPTGTGPFTGNGVGGGGQIALGAPLGGSLDLYAGAGFTVQDRGPVRGVLYEPARIHGFLALEWRPWQRLSLVVETDAASRLVANVEQYPGLHWVMNATGRLDLGAHARLDLGFTENFKNQLSTTDFALYFGLGFRP
jgi:hypothetical protein